MGLKELLAAKKAAAAKESEEVNKELPKEAEEKKAVSAISNLAAMGLDSIEESKEETVMNSVPAGRKETFSEMMARKKREKETSNSSTIVSEDGKVDAPVVVAKVIPKIELSEEQKEVLNEIEDDTEAQAYTDIALKINSLKYSATGDDLTKAMNTLTAALHKNPSASMLLLDPDIGQMTLAIRRLVGDELEEAKVGKKEKKTKAAKQIELTPERLAKQFDIPDDM